VSDTDAIESVSSDRVPVGLLRRPWREDVINLTRQSCASGEYLRAPSRLRSGRLPCRSSSQRRPEPMRTRDAGVWKTCAALNIPTALS